MAAVASEQDMRNPLGRSSMPIGLCIANDRPTWPGPLCAGLPLEALRSLAMQG